MNKEYENQLIQELKSEGATFDEEKELLRIVHVVKKTSEINRPEDLKKLFLNKLSARKKKRTVFSPQIYAPFLLFVVLLFILIGGVASAQKSLPGQPLYPVKILSENIIRTVNPSFNNEILKRRSEEIKSLSEKNSKDYNLLQKTLDDYSKELESSNNSKGIVESKENLEKAKEISTEVNKKRLEEIIKKTENKILEEDKNRESEEREKSTKTEVKSDKTAPIEESKKNKEEKKHEGEDSQKDKDDD